MVVAGVSGPVGSLVGQLAQFAGTRAVGIAGGSQKCGFVKTSRRKASDGPALHIWGSSELLQTLIAVELVDEYRIWVFPLVLGEGKRLFENGVPPGGLAPGRDAKHAQGRPHQHIPPGRFAPAGDSPS